MITKRCWATGGGNGGVTGFVAGGMGRIDPDGTLTIAPGEVDGGAVTVIVSVFEVMVVPELFSAVHVYTWVPIPGDGTVRVPVAEVPISVAPL